MSSADYQQVRLYYYSGFLTGEGSICIIKAKNSSSRKGFYYTPDITVSNSEISLLREMNKKIGNNQGVITRIKGGYNLSWRGKKKVSEIICFLKKYPPLQGYILLEKIKLLQKAVKILLKSSKSHKRLKKIELQIEKIREELKQLKKGKKPKIDSNQKRLNREKTGYFLAGIIDAEGSMGFKKSGQRLQSYFCVLMKEEGVINLLLKFLGFGNKYYRPSEKLWHYETAKKINVLKISKIFLEEFPVKLVKNIQRLQKIQQILNDYTPRS